MTYGLIGAALALAAFLAVDVAASLWAAVLGPAIERGSRGFEPQSRQRLLFAVRLLPAAAAALFVGVLLASYVDFEPRHTGEAVGAGLLIVATLSLALVLGGVVRAARSWWSVRRLSRSWLAAGTPLRFAGISTPVTLIQSAFPIVSVVGLVRPRLFVASQVMDALSPTELRAVIAHEAGHLRSGDNWKRLLLRACPDALALMPAGRRLEQAWAATAEEAADEHAARLGDRLAVHLASALVKVARLAPPQTRAPAGISALHDGDDVATRVRRLLSRSGSLARASTLPELAAWITVTALPLLLVIAAATPGVGAGLHEVAEAIVRLGS